MSIHDHHGANGTLIQGRERPLTLVKLPAPEAPPAPAPARPAEQPAPKPERLYVRAGRKARAIATHERTRTAGQLAVRHGSYVVGGTRIVTRRAWDGRSAARYERMLRACEAAGKMDEAKEWEERGRQFRAARHQRRMDLLKSPQDLARSVAAGTAVGAGSLLGLGIALAIANEDPSWIFAPTMFVFDLLRWAVAIGSVVWGPLMVVGPWLALAAVWAVGRNRQAAPQWALPAKQRTDDEPITPSRVVLALRHLGISALRKAILAMEDGGASMLSPIVIAGCGVEVDVLLPLEVSTEEVMGRRRKLAENLGRHEHEVFITVAPAARTVRLWIADSGALDEPVPASPLVTDPTMTADYKNGRAPWGQDLRGDAALMSLYQMHVLVTGLSNQGKTASLRALALWLCLDPTVEFRIGDLKGVGDWRMFLGLATVLIEGPTDDHVMAVTHMAEDVFDEMQRRIMAPAGTVFPPLVLIVDEAQVAYGSGAVGPDKRPYGGQKATSRYFQAVKGIHDQGRVVNVTIWEGTQDPTDQNLPKRSREGNHIRGALALGTKSQAEFALGENPVAAGAAPHKLRQGLDKGQLVVAGSGVKLDPGQVSMNIRTHYINDDEAEEITDRAKARRSDVSTHGASVEERDHLADLRDVLGSQERVRTPEVLHRLKNLCAPTYSDWDGSRLRRVLTDAGEDTGTYNGYPVVHRDRVLRALANRDLDGSEA
jgi:S-DNA-T family DNA segregation ATPase FtsK/SpoIIIE